MLKTMVIYAVKASGNKIISFFCPDLKITVPLSFVGAVLLIRA